MSEPRKLRGESKEHHRTREHGDRVGEHLRVHISPPMLVIQARRPVLRTNPVYDGGFRCSQDLDPGEQMTRDQMRERNLMSLLWWPARAAVCVLNARHLPIGSLPVQFIPHHARRGESSWNVMSFHPDECDPE